MEALAEKGNPKAIKFGVPMAKRKDCHFSFAGLKTVLLAQSSCHHHDKHIDTGCAASDTKCRRRPYQSS